MSSAASYRPIVDGFEDDLDLTVEDDSVLLDSAEQNQTNVPAPSPSGEQTKAEVSSKLAAPQRPRLSYFNLITLSAYWFGWSVLMMPLLVILVPHQIVQIAGEEGKGATLGITLLLGSICSLFCSPAFGAFSDTCKHPMGRRRPFMIVGACIASVSLIVMSLSKSLALFTFSFFVLSLAMPMIMAPYSALIPDVVPEEQRGVTSGWLGAFSTLGFFCGGMVTYRIDVLGVFGCYFFIIVLHGACVAVTVLNVIEEPLKEVHHDLNLMEFLRGFTKPFRSMDFRWLFFTRFLIQMGTITVQEYLQYYLKDAIQVFEINGVQVATSAERAVSLLFLPLLVGAFISSICAGIVSDYYGGRRKFLVYIAGSLMSASALAFALTRSFEFDIVLAFIFGLGWGCFSAIDWAMATDVLPDADEFAKDMGVWSVSFVLPQVLAAPIAGNLLDFFEKIGPQLHIGYTIVFSLSAVYFVAGTYFVKNIEAVK